MGSTEELKAYGKLHGDHPHIHGEHPLKVIRPVYVTGSPPYTWGALSMLVPPNLPVRITPIYMGSTSSAPFSLSPSRDHPHIHGEHPGILSITKGGLGSPPYTWGALSIINRPSFSVRDHPHIHGEHYGWLNDKTNGRGSPPYTWGAPLMALSDCF